jgi:uncharacterized delta-60 repeat protein
MHTTTTSLPLLAALAFTLTACAGDQTPTPTPTPGFSLALSMDKAPILQGASVPVTATVSREADFVGPVDLSFAGLPAGVTATAGSIASGATTSTILLTAAATAPHSLPTTVTVTGTSGDRTASRTLAVTVRGQPGSVDTSFGSSNGPVETALGTGEDSAEALAVQSDGKIIVAGRTVTTQGTTFGLVRYDRDGSLDTAFGTGGKATTQMGTLNSAIYALALQSDGKILAAGAADFGATASGLDFAVARYNPDGSLDATFGTGGKVTTDFGLSKADSAYAILLQADGKILVGGETDQVTTGLDFALARYNQDGSLDATFGTGGKVTTAIKSAAGRDVIFSLGEQRVGDQVRIVAAGGDGDFILARYTSAGTLDTSFGTAGKIDRVFTSSIGSARGLAVTADAKLVVVGHNNHDFSLVRLTDTGTLDTGFGAAGKVVTQVSTTNWDEAQAVALQPDGKIVVGGWVYTGGSSAGDFAVVRYDSAGALDPSFGAGGKVTTAVASGTKDDTAHAVALQTDDRVPVVRILLAGSANESNHDFAVVRYWP